MEKHYSLQDWQLQVKKSKTAFWKVILYDLFRPLISNYAKRYLSQQTIEKLKPDLLLLERGFPIQTRRKWATRGEYLSNKTILVQGTGTGWEIISWAELHPKEIIAVDLYNFGESWSEITEYCASFYNVPVTFVQGSLDKLDCIDDESIDICGSDAVYEHCQNLADIIAETKRVLKPRGIVYASYGPLWYCATGDHYARGGLRNVYNHLLLDKVSYGEYYRKYLKPDEDFQSGGRYIGINMFSYLRTEEYIQIFLESGFEITDLILEISSLAVKFIARYPHTFRKLVKRYSFSCHEDDFKIKGNYIRMRKSYR